MQATLIVPAPFTAVSGGYAYDRRIVSELRGACHAVRVIELSGTHPITDELARGGEILMLNRLLGLLKA